MRRTLATRLSDNLIQYSRLVGVKVKVQVVPRRTRRPTLAVLGLTNGIVERPLYCDKLNHKQAS
jgi:hypothetical protein